MVEESGKAILPEAIGLVELPFLDTKVLGLNQLQGTVEGLMRDEADLLLDFLMLGVEHGQEVGRDLAQVRVLVGY
jgi:hypothetical protein